MTRNKNHFKKSNIMAKKNTNSLEAPIHSNGIPHPVFQTPGSDYSFILTSVNLIAPDPKQPRKFFDPVAQKELTESVRTKGVLQPILVRPDADGFMLVCGERRLKAAIAAGLNKIPAMVRHLADDEALEMQITENLQRQDVHPMEEAVAFRTFLDHHPGGIPEAAARFAKSEGYIAQRLSLNSLTAELQDDFFQKKMLIGHAIQLARLSTDQQIQCRKHESDKEGFGSLEDLREFIDDEILRKLSAAPWKRDDADLVPKAGACTTCPKRTGASPLLFPDIAKEDTCLDPKCYQTKREAFIVKRAKEIIDANEPGTGLLKYGDPVPKEIGDYAKKMGFEILDYYSNGVHSWSSSGSKKIHAFCISGRGTGLYEDAWVESSKAAAKASKGKETSSSIDAEVEGIRTRTKRAAELDSEKVQARILEALEKHPTLKAPGLEMNKTEEVLVWWSILTGVGYQGDNFLRGAKIPSGPPEALLSALQKITPSQKAFILRKAVQHHTRGAIFLKNENGFIARKWAESLGDIPVATFDKEQAGIREKREVRAAERIKALRASKKGLAVQKSGKKRGK
jgi:ParB/RepB/Spo0J family partition protein